MMVRCDVLLGEIVFGAQEWLPYAGAAAVLLIGATLWRNRSESRQQNASLALATILKVCGILLLVSCLLEPLYRGVRPRSGANAFIVLTDDSQSMTVKSGSRIRSEGLQDLLKEESLWRTRLQQDFDVRSYRFDEQLRHVDDPSTLTYEGIGSGLFGALATLQTRFHSRPVAGALVFSDGNATDQPISDDYDFPLYVVVDDDADEMRDIRIQQMNVSQTNFETSPVSVTAVIEAQSYKGQSITARVVDQAGQPLESQDIEVNRQGTAEFKFRFRPEDPGLSFHRLETFLTGSDLDLSDGDELTIANNRRWMTTDRGGGPFRILYVGGRPNWEFKFLRRALDEDDEIELRGLVRIAKKQPKFSFQDRSGLSDRNQLFEGFEDEDEEDLETFDQTVFIRLGVDDDAELADGFPQDADTLFGYHAIILDDVEAKFFTAEQMLLMRRFVSQRGGGLMMLGGAESFGGGAHDKTPLGEVLPVYAKRADRLLSDITDAIASRGESLSWNLSREGWLQDWTRVRSSEAEERKRFSQLVGLEVINPIAGLKPGASLIATLQSLDTDPIPALVTQRFGRGRSAALLAGDLWRWGMHREDPKQQDLQQFWRQVIRWLVAEVPMRVSLTAEPSRSSFGSRTVAVTVKDEQYLPHDNAEVRVEVTTPDGEVVELTAEPSDQEAGVYLADYFPRDDGPYRVSAMVVTADGQDLPSKQAGWTTQRAAFEFERLATNRQLLEDVARQSGGEVVQARNLERFVADLPSRQVPVTESWTYPLWHQPWVLILAIVCLCSEWGIRRWRGLA